MEDSRLGEVMDCGRLYGQLENHRTDYPFKREASWASQLSLKPVFCIKLGLEFKWPERERGASPKEFVLSTTEMEQL
jgi:hypothetical protein